MIREHLPQIIKNRAVRNLFDIKANQQKQLLLGDLVRMHPFNPRLVNKLYSLSNFGLQEKYISKFSGARSIQQATISKWKNETDVLASVKSVESGNSDYISKKRSGDELQRRLLAQDLCITELAQELRETMWGLQLEGITMPAQQEQTMLYRWNEIPLAWAPRAVLLIVDATVNNNCQVTRGAHTPYYGSATRMRVRRAPMQVMESGTLSVR